MSWTTWQDRSLHNRAQMIGTAEYGIRLAVSIGRHPVLARSSASKPLGELDEFEGNLHNLLSIAHINLHHTHSRSAPVQQSTTTIQSTTFTELQVRSSKLKQFLEQFRTI